MFSAVEAGEARTMWKVVVLQACAALLVALGAGLLAGSDAGMSAVFGGLAYVLPNALFVARLKLAAASGRASGVAFLAWEGFKLVLTVGILAAVAHHYAALHWIALLAGLFVTLMVNLFALLLRI